MTPAARIHVRVRILGIKLSLALPLVLVLAIALAWVSGLALCTVESMLRGACIRDRGRVCCDYYDKHY